MADFLLDIKAEVKATQPEQMTLSSERLRYCEKQYADLIKLVLVADPLSANPTTKKRGRKNKKQSLV